jgi:hypothetical protein
MCIGGDRGKIPANTRYTVIHTSPILLEAHVFFNVSPLVPARERKPKYRLQQHSSLLLKLSSVYVARVFY